MNEPKLELVYSVLISHREIGDLSYQINPSLTLGLDPRNDIVLVSPHISAQHLSIKEVPDGIILTLLGEVGHTTLNGKMIYQNQNYLIIPGDKILIDHISIKLKKEIGIRIQKIEYLKKENTIQNISKETNFSSNGINLIKSQSESLNSSTKINSSLKTKPIKNETPELKHAVKIIKKNLPYRFSNRKLGNFILGAILDLYLTYFILSLTIQIKLHLYVFYLILEMAFLFIFQGPFFNYLLNKKFHRQLTIFPLLVMFTVYPLTKSTFQKIIIAKKIPPNNQIDLHAVSLNSTSLKYNVKISSYLDQNLFFAPWIINKTPGFKFINSDSMNTLFFYRKQSETIESLKHLINRSHPFRLPIKTEMTNLEFKNYFLKNISLTRQSFKDLILENGPFVNHISDSIDAFLGDIGPIIELVETNEDCPVLVFRDQKMAKVFIFGKTNMTLFQYDRPVDHTVENAFIEKFLAKIKMNLLDSAQSEFGILEMFDSLPDYYGPGLYQFMMGLKTRVLKNKNPNEIELYKNSLQSLLLDLNSEFRKADPKLLDQLESLKI